jgi:tRNA A-37 threonylcarbamoyl transferase component Bud32
MEGRNVGYFLEYVNGTSLGGLGLQSFREAVLKLVSVMEKVHGAGVGHGDLDSSSNIRVTISPVGIKLIDPYVPSDKTDADLIKQDKESLRQMLHMANGTLSR